VTADVDRAERAPVPAWAVRWGPGAVLALLAGATLSLLYREELVDMIDLRIYRMGGDLVGSDAAVYDAKFEILALPFTYPPISAVMMAPLAAMPESAAVLVWSALSVFALVATWRACLPAAGPVLLVAVSAASLVLEPVHDTLARGQINLLLMALVAVDLVPARSHRWRGVLLGIAAGIKLTPLVFFAFLVLTRQWRVLRNAVAGLAATVLVGVLVMPHGSWRYWTELLPDSGRIGDPAYAGNQSVMGVLSRIGDEAGWVRPAWFVLSVLLAVAGLLMARAWWSRGDRLTAVSVCALAVLFASPVSWNHHWVWTIPLGLVLVRTAAGRTWGWIGGAAWAAVFVWAPFLHVPHHHHVEVDWNWWEALLGNGYVIAGAVAFGVLAWRVTRPNTEVEPVGG
jgi:alpha-1,2-mannosyltransferase